MKKLIVLFAAVFVLACFLVPVNGSQAKISSIAKRVVIQKTGNYGYEVTITFNTASGKVLSADSPDGTVVSYTYSSAVDNAGVVTVTNFLIKFIPTGSSQITYDGSGDYF
ncbi:hypothetical protein [Mucilaginibacter sp. OK268]|uniref:hypothetical protein n=1 Tax=Mucilaginibacter sp. OK268 TaxID=1881048 RepID=UPI000B8227D8|nr:hypothetical protein [Mucilaginibacter sp. OK268]